MGSAMSLSCSKRKATSQDVDSESCKRRKICSTNDAENCIFIPDESSWSLCANRVITGSVAAVALTNFRFQQDNQESNSSSLSLPSPATSVSRNWKHDVFPSFHGADVRRTFLSHILESFRRKGIDTFIDNNIERSKSIGPELKEAIKGSKIAIVLLSRKYASSSWCLDELAEIMKCREMVGQIVMTIFYEVDPTDIKKQTGEFGKAFTKTCRGKPKEQVERWRKALEDVATIAGEHSRNWSNEADMIEKISTDVSNILNLSIPSRDFDGFVGMTPHMEMMEKYLRLDLDEVRMVGIWGPPGIGKTTIAACMFDRFSNRFPFAAIMTDIRECYPRHCLNERNAQLKLQEQMLSQIFNQKETIISHLGVAPERLKDKKVFLVLDEVGHLGQLDALAKETRWFGPGSRIIITTEDLGVLKAHGINHVYKVGYPSNDEAFGQKQPHEGFDEIAREVMALAGELPLGLKVLGSALRGKSKPEWERTLPRLRTSLDGKIGSIIQFSFDALCDEDKYLFLYIACLFNFQSVHRVEEVLANKFSHVGHGLDVLDEKSLISIKNGRIIQMHTLLEQFGRETSRKQFVHHGYRKHQLLVGERDIYEVLDDDTTDNRRFIGINLDLREEELKINEKTLERIHDFQFVKINLRQKLLHFKIIHQPERVQLALEDLIYHSPRIRSLKWFGYQNICLPSTFNPEFLVELDMSDSKLRKLWEGTKQLRNLKWMDLSNSGDLKELPNLSTATNLEELRLSNCSSLVELPSSIEKLTSLQILDLYDCSSLVELPSFGNATKLKKLDLENCSSLVKLPPSINANNLQELKLQNCSSLIELPLSIGTANNLWKLDISGCSSLVKLPSSIGDMTNLEVFYLSDCFSLVELPSSIGDMTNLATFHLSNCSNLVELPSSIGNLQKLVVLTMWGCSKLEALPTNINLISLRILDLTDCSQLKSFPEISTNISELRLKGTAIKEVPLSITSWSRLAVYEMSYSVNVHTSTRKCAVLPGTQVPACFNHRATSGDSLKIKLKESPLPTTLRFKACIMLVKVNEEMSSDLKSMSVEIVIRDEQNDLKVQYTPRYHGIYPVLTEHIYTFELEVQEVTSTELVFEFTSFLKSNWKIGECGILQKETRSLRRSSWPDLPLESSRAFFRCF